LDIREGKSLAFLPQRRLAKRPPAHHRGGWANPRAEDGEILAKRTSLHLMKSHQAAGAGIALVPEDRCIMRGPHR